MKKLLLTIASMLAFVACTGDETYVDTHGDRIDELERRADLNDELDAARDIAIKTNTLSITILQQDLINAEARLAQMIADEEAARIDGDEELAEDLANAVSLQSVINLFVQLQIASVNSKASLALSRISSLKDRVEDLEEDVDVLQDQVSDLRKDVDDLEDDMRDVKRSVQLNSRRIADLKRNLFLLGLSNLLIDIALQGQINDIKIQMINLESRVSSNETSVADLRKDVDALDLRMGAAEGAITSLGNSLVNLGLKIDATQAQLDEQGVKVYKCGPVGNGSEERLFKINGKFYAVMNRVTMKDLEVITDSSTTTVSTPDLCFNNGRKLKLPDSSGNCKGNGWSLLPGSSVEVLAGTTETVEVVDSVEMAMEHLLPGTYITTDGSNPGCVFSITNSGSTNLVQVQ